MRPIAAGSFFSSRLYGRVRSALTAGGADPPGAGDPEAIDDSTSTVNDLAVPVARLPRSADRSVLGRHLARSSRVRSRPAESPQLHTRLTGTGNSAIRWSLRAGRLRILPALCAVWGGDQWANGGDSPEAWSGDPPLMRKR